MGSVAGANMVIISVLGKRYSDIKDMNPSSERSGATNMVQTNNRNTDGGIASRRFMNLWESTSNTDSTNIGYDYRNDDEEKTDSLSEKACGDKTSMDLTRFLDCGEEMGQNTARVNISSGNVYILFNLCIFVFFSKKNKNSFHTESSGSVDRLFFFFF
jgi:hypothetical protein